jgi:hypothetical protein
MEAGEALKYAAELVAQNGEAFMLQHPYFPGCGTRFQWYWGSNACCPECGRAYVVLIDKFKTGQYKPTGEGDQ